jgi:acetyl-CoA C-acetyltransferase
MGGDWQPIQADKLRSLRPVFKADGGTVTAANAPNNADGAAVLVLVSGTRARALSLPVVARLRGWGEAAQAPEWFTTSPALAIPRALAHAGVSPADVDLYEINEGTASLWSCVCLRVYVCVCTPTL